ncbi:hypothetical protein LF1_20340 [Rubripirellula obstinata]|uniref:Uncharacterized protein n=1 Tax=Rubripirellula obstinata TaxID=406547 RepID=A0A5B1CIR7_9BACT|nr:hypothetical protein [Rubripirellula obstinata]KAA1259500.1 hypothetical protein LF1_20340 [Rubripirellula obstinata]
MTETVDFLSPRLVGDRFNGHAIPLEVLKDLSVLEELIVEVAKWHYRQDNPTRKRIPKGFADEVSLQVTEIGEGSAIPKVVLAIAAASSSLFPVDHREYFEKAKASIVEAVDCAENQKPVTGLLSENHLAYFDRIGRSLRDSESLELNYPDTNRPARLNKTTRRYLTLATSSTQGYTEEVRIRGRVFEADQEKERFRLRLMDGSQIPSPIQPEHLDKILEAFNKFKEGSRVIIEGVGRYDRRTGRLTKLESIEHISVLDAMDVGIRLEEFKRLKNGWMEGKGRAPKNDHLDWLAEAFESSYPDDLPSPYLYPTLEGGVQAEWSSGDLDASLEIDLDKRLSAWHLLNTETDEESEAEFNLLRPEDWVKLAEMVKGVFGGNEA